MTGVQETAERILAAAAELIAECGYKATTTRAIAERAGVNEITIFRHFNNKLGVLEALAESWIPRMAGFAVSNIAIEGDTRATLEKLANIEVSQAMESGPAAMRVMLDARTIPEIARLMSSGPGDNHAGLAAYLAERQVAGDLRQDIDPSVMAEAFFALTSQTILSRQMLNGSSDPAYGVAVEEAARQLLAIFISGVGL